MNVTGDRHENCILVVDDSVDNLYLMQFILENQGYKVSLADSGKKALEIVRKNHPDLILLDLMMPQMDGYEVVHRLREDENVPEIPVFLVTANKYVSRYEAIAAGADGLIYKPININKFLSKVEQILETKNNSNLN